MIVTAFLILAGLEALCLRLPLSARITIAMTILSLAFGLYGAETFLRVSSCGPRVTERFLLPDAVGSATGGSDLEIVSQCDLQLGNDEAKLPLAENDAAGALRLRLA
jgi:hypothetical protein